MHLHSAYTRLRILNVSLHMHDAHLGKLVRSLSVIFMVLLVNQFLFQNSTMGNAVISELFLFHILTVRDRGTQDGP